MTGPPLAGAIEGRVVERKRSRVDRWATMNRPKAGTPYDWEDWERYAKQQSPVRWRLLGAPAKFYGRLRAWLRRHLKRR